MNRAGNPIKGASTLAPFRAAFARIVDLVAALRRQGLPVEAVDFGGGLGIPYRNEPASDPAGLAAVIKAAFQHLEVHLAIEDGRWLVDPVGVLLASVVLDASMSNLVRQAMCDAWQRIVPVSAVDPHRRPLSSGAVCESGDTFSRSRRLPPRPANASVAMLDAGAYIAVMSSTYNARPLAAEAWVEGDRWSVVRDRDQRRSGLRSEPRIGDGDRHGETATTEPGRACRQAECRPLDASCVGHASVVHACISIGSRIFLGHKRYREHPPPSLASLYRLMKQHGGTDDVVGRGSGYFRGGDGEIPTVCDNLPYTSAHDFTQQRRPQNAMMTWRHPTPASISSQHRPL
jgi:Pyridoxal-dependent decarboxylase, C-terminal sheet domain/Pyridoxal-dependent decarboxylase, pyridoxal binding domain